MPRSFEEREGPGDATALFAVALALVLVAAQVWETQSIQAVTGDIEVLKPIQLVKQ